MPRIQAAINNRADGPRRTTLSVNGTAVDMVEHILAALAGLQIDNCAVFVDRAEMPGLDGSSQPFVEALLQAGIREQEQRRNQLVITDTIRVGDSESWLEASPLESGNCELRYELSYPDDPSIGDQSAEIVLTPESFCNQLAAARTFVTRSEAELLRRQGLGRRVNFSDILVFDEHGPVQNTLRYPDECARHKLLDMVGDFALSGLDLCGRITAHRSGHRLNAELVRQLLCVYSIETRFKKTA
jgi:UDP-3-O-acyl N-acetylglucosamine deacetylase